MANLIDFLKNNPVSVLHLPVHLEDQLRKRDCHSLLDLFSGLQLFKAGKTSLLSGMESEDVVKINLILKDHLVESGLSRNSAKPPGVPPSKEQIKQIPSSALVLSPQKRPEIPPAENPYLQIVGARLLEYESVFRNKLRNIDLVGEILLTRDEVDELSGSFRRIFSKNPSTKALDIVERCLPSSFIVYLVAQGVYGYNGGDYWTAVGIALDHSTDSRFGQLFERIIKRYNLSVFEELQEKSSRYISLILAHGGIPVYSLDDYFNNLILPSIMRPQYSSLEGSDLVDALLASSLVINTDKPVIHFLEYGGRVAQDIFNRSRRLVLAWQRTQIVPSPGEIGLPGHMVDFFAEWVKDQDSSAAAIRSPRKSLKRPELCFDPWGIGVFLKLPMQSMPLLDSEISEWEVEFGDVRQNIPVQVDAQGWTQEITLRVIAPADSYTVKFLMGQKEFVWKFNTPDMIFFFDPDKATLLARPLSGETWILYPRQLEAKVTEGDGTQIEDLPTLPGAWYKLKIEGWDLANASKLSVAQNGMVYKSFDIKKYEHFSPPTLVNGKLLETNLGDGDTVPIYIGKPPILRIPIVTGTNPEEYLKRWRISVKSIGFAAPDLQVQSQIQISELRDSAIILNINCIEIRLEHKSLLTKRPIGTFEVSAYGPLGNDKIFVFSIIPECTVSDLNELYIPGRDGAPEVQLSIDLNLIDILQYAGTTPNLRIQNNRPGKYSIIAHPDICRLDLQIVREYLGDEIIVPFSLRVRRLRWRLVMQDVLEKWSDDLLNVAISSFLNWTSPLLIISLPGVQPHSVNLYLRLLDINGTELVRIQSAPKSVRHPSDFWRFDLSVLRGNLRETSVPIMRLELIGDGVATDQVIALPVVSFTQTIDIKRVTVQVDELAEQYKLKVSWAELTHLQHRNIHIWSLWRPWQSVLSLPVPDNAIGYIEFPLTKDQLVGGNYRLGFAIVDPWVGDGPPAIPPEIGSSWTTDFEISVTERLASLKTHANGFSEHLEFALADALRTNSIELDTELRWCCRNVRLANGQQVLILYQYLKRSGQETLLKLLGENVIAPSILAQLIGNVQDAIIPVNDVADMLKYAPPPSEWTDSACELIFDFEDQRWRINALRGLVIKKPPKAIKHALSLIRSGSITLEDAVELLYENKPNVIEPLKYGYPKNATAQKLLDLLSLYNPHTGLPTVRPGTWVRTNAGWGKIEEILDPITHGYVEEFMENQGAFKLFVRMHIEIDPSFEGERAVIDMQKKTVTFPRARQVFCCKHCQDFVTANRDMYRTHMSIMHSGKYPTPPISDPVISLEIIEFNHSRK